MYSKLSCRSTWLNAECGHFILPLLICIAFLQSIVLALPLDHSSSILGRNLLKETPSKPVDLPEDSPHIFIQGKVEQQSPMALKDSVGLFLQARRGIARLSTERARQDEVEDPVFKEKTIQPLEDREPRKSASIIETMRHQIDSAKKFLSFVRINSNHRLLRDLKSQIRENEHILKNSRRDADLPKSVSEKIKALDRVLAKARDQRTKCEALVKKLRSLLLVNEEKIQLLKEEAKFLGRLAARTMPKGLHCLALQLTIKYYNQPIRWPVPAHELEDPRLYHYAIFSENILAASVVVNSTVFHVKEPYKHVFHVLTDGLNYAAMKAWFWANTPGGTIVEVRNLDDIRSLYFRSPFFSKLARRYLQPALSKPTFESLEMGRKSSENFGQIDQLQLYLPDMFPNLEKILVLDDDIVVRKDLTGLWTENLNGKVSGAVTSCRTSNYHVDKLLNLSPKVILNRVDLSAWVSQYCIHIFDLKELKRQNITEIYKSMSHLNQNQAGSVSGTVPPVVIAVHNNTHTLDNFWNVLNLDDISDAKRDEFRSAAAIHYGGYVKPWLEMNGKSYKAFWTRFVNYENPLLQECNINK